MIIDLKHIKLDLVVILLFSLVNTESSLLNGNHSVPDYESLSVDSLFASLKKRPEEPHKILAILHTRMINADIKKKPDFYKEIGEYYYANEILDSARYYFDKGQEFALQEKMNELSAFFYLRLGMIQNTRANYHDALRLLQQAKEKAIETPSYALQSDIYRNAGNVYWGMGIYDKALNNYLISLEIARKQDLKRNIASATNNIGSVYQAINNFENARKYYHKAYSIAKKNDYKWIAAIAANNIGDLLNLTEKPDSSIHYFTLSLNIMEELGSKFYTGIILFNIGEIFLQIDSIDVSRRYFFESLELAKLSDDKLGIVNCYLKLGESYLKEEDLNKANEFIRLGLHNAGEIASFSLLELAYKLKTDFYTMKGYVDSAFISQKKRLELKDSITRQESGDAVARLENQYREEKTAMEIENLRKNKKNSRLLFFVIVGAISIILIIIIISLQNARKKSLVLTEKNLEIELQQKLLMERNKELIDSQEELKIINDSKDQFLTILSHDLRNPITAIRGFVELMINNYESISDDKKKVFLQEIFDSVERLSLLLTNVLFWVRSQTKGIKNHPRLLPLSKGIDTNLGLYTLIAKSKGIEMHNNIPEDFLIFADQNIFDTIIRNLISNALKFTEKNGSIIFNARKEQRQIILEVTDTGIGMSQDKIEKIREIMNNSGSSGTLKEQGTGLGLNVVQDFVMLMGGAFDIKSIPGEGSTFLIKLPVPKAT